MNVTQRRITGQLNLIEQRRDAIFKVRLNFPGDLPVDSGESTGTKHHIFTNQSWWLGNRRSVQSNGTAVTLRVDHIEVLEDHVQIR